MKNYTLTLNKKIGTESMTYYILLSLIWVSFIMKWVGYHSLLSSPLSILITSVMLTICYIINSKKVVTRLDVLVLITNICSLVITVCMYDSLGCVLTFYNIFILLQLLNNIKFDLKRVQHIRLTIVLLLGAWILTMDKTYIYSGLLLDITGKTMNSNMYAIFFLVLYFFLFLWVEDSFIKIYQKNIIKTIITVVALYYIYISNCRMAIVTLLLSIIGILFKKNITENYKFFYKILLIGSISFIAIYLVIWISNENNISFMGKALFTGRNYVWKSTLELIKEYPMWGSGTKYMIHGFHNKVYHSAHNVYLALWKTIGIIPTLTYIMYYSKGKNMKNISSANMIAKVFILSLIILSTTETVINDSDMMYITMLLFLTVKESGIKKEHNRIDN